MKIAQMVRVARHGGAVNHLNWLPRPLWAAWRDLTWAREERRKWIDSVQAQYDRGDDEKSRSRSIAIKRVQYLLRGNGGDCYWDCDDNVPQEWARVLQRRWKI